jgi:leucyl/phenylalanyl-tRNA--protein transferase
MCADEPLRPSEQLVWLEPGAAFPPLDQAWNARSQAPGLLAAGRDLTVDTLLEAYGQSLFPWYSSGQPILWWSPDPRMVLAVNDFKLHRSLQKTLRRFVASQDCEIRIDHAFEQVITACAQTPRGGQPGTWIVPAMAKAYMDLHHAGYAHSLETWIQGRLVGGLYCTAIGQAVFGESMFSLATDASKIALAALVAFCRFHGIERIDCQQKTGHLASLGAQEIPRTRFAQMFAQATREQAPPWKFSPLLWSEFDGLK